MTGSYDTGTIGQRYGAVVKKHDIINKISTTRNPWNRRNIISLWIKKLLIILACSSCALQTMLDVRRVDGHLSGCDSTQRSNDMR